MESTVKKRLWSRTNKQTSKELNPQCGNDVSFVLREEHSDIAVVRCMYKLLQQCLSNTARLLVSRDLTKEVKVN
jgi:hypothetical protein